jgi:hypothetical protein
MTRPSVRSVALGAGVLALAACSCPTPPPRVVTVAPPPPSRAIDDTVAGSSVLSDDATRAFELGASPLGVAKAEHLGEGEHVGTFVEPRVGSCVLVLARGAKSVGDLDLLAFGDDGGLVAADQASAARATVLLCPPIPKRVYVSARVMRGAGLTALGLQDVPIDKADAVARALEVRGRPGQDTGRLDSWPGLEAALRAHRASVGGVFEDIRRVPVPVSPQVESRVAVRIEDRRCVDLFVLPGDDVDGVDATVEDADGRVLGRDRQKARSRSLVVCAEEARDVTLVVRSRAGQGLAAVVVGRSEAGAQPTLAGAQTLWSSQPLELASARTSLAESRKGEGYGAGSLVGTGTSKVGQRSSFAVDLPAGCVRLDAVVGKPSGDVVMEVWDDQGQLVGEHRGGLGASVLACGPKRKARVELEALARPGPFAIELRAEPASPKQLVAAPAAAARLFARLVASGEPASAKTLENSQALSLDPAARKTVRVIVPASSCVLLAGALDGAAAGLELSVREGSEALVVRGHRSASSRLCAGDFARTLDVDVRARSGKAEVLFVSLPSP